MALLKFSELSSLLPVGGDCGADLEAEGDDEHLNYLARVEGVLPASFAEFDRATIDFASEYEAASGLLRRSGDLRVLVLLGKLLILDRRFEDFAGVLAAISKLLDEHWDTVHPAGDIEFRRGVLMALDDMPHVVMPLQSLPLFESRNLGRVSFRSYLLANGTVQPRETETPFQASAVATALERAEEAEIVASREQLLAIRTTLGAMAGVFAKHLGAGRDLQLPKLRKLADEMFAWLDAEFVRRNPAAAPATTEGGEGGQPAAAEPMPAIASHADAKAALDRVMTYFARNEPSSPALLLLRQGRQLADVSFIDALRTLMPDSFASAMIRVGKNSGFALPLDRLADLPDFEPLEDEEPEPEGDGASGWDAPDEEPEYRASYEDEAAENEPSDEEASGEDHESGSDGVAEDDASEHGQSENGEAEYGAAEDEPEPEASLEDPPPPPLVLERTEPPRRPPQVRTQREAVEMISQVASFYRSREPSSPLPLILDRATSLVGRDFLAVIEEMLPASHLRPPEDT